jgi:adenylate cyclase
MLALFGLTSDAEQACREALRAAATIASNVEDLNQFLAHDLREPIRFGIGIHAGEVIVGDIGYRDHMVFTALGDAVNVAARLQDMTKSIGCEAIVSQEVCRTGRLAADDLPRQEVQIRGRAEPMVVHIIADAKSLLGVLDHASAAAA